MEEERKITRRGHPYLISSSIIIIVFALTYWLSPKFSPLYFLYLITPYLVFYNFMYPWNRGHEKMLLKSGAKVDGEITNLNTLIANARNYTYRSESGSYFQIEAKYLYLDNIYNSKTKMKPLGYISTKNLPKKGDHVTLYIDPQKPEDFIVYEISNYKIVGI